MSCAPDAARAAFVPLTDGEMPVRRGIRRTYPYDIFTCPNFSIRHLSFPNHLFLPSYAPYLPAREDGWGLVLPRGRGLPEPGPLEGWSFGFRPPRRYCENGEYSRRRGRANRVHIGPWRKGGAPSRDLGPAWDGTCDCSGPPIIVPCHQITCLFDWSSFA